MRFASRLLLPMLALVAIGLWAAGCNPRDMEAKPQDKKGAAQEKPEPVSAEEVTAEAAAATSKIEEGEKPSVEDEGEEGEAGEGEAGEGAVVAPVGGEAQPAEGVVSEETAAAPVEGEAAPAEAAAPAEGEAAPAEGEAAAPAEGEAKPAEGEAAAPAEGEAKAKFSKGAASIKIKNKKGTITFPHRDHQDMMKCKKCHHTYEAGVTPEACTACHNAKADAPTFKSVGHGMCKNCHKDEGAPTECSGCHG